jgi:hypothetical protein
MFGFQSTTDVLIVAIFAQTIGLSLIILIIYFKIRKIHYKNIDLSEKLDEKLDRVESKLSYLSKVLVISANGDKFKYPTSSLDPSAYYQPRVTTHEDLDSQSLLKDTTFYAQKSADSKITDTSLTATANATATKASASDTSHNTSFSEISKSNKPGDAVAKDLTTDFVQNSNGFTSTKSFDQNDHIEKKTNPEIDKIEKEILTALKRLGGNDNDYGDLDGNDGDNRKGEVVYPASKKSDRKVKNFD